MPKTWKFTWWDRFWIRQLWLYRLEHWLFKWKTDEDGDIAFVLFNWIAFIKYKEHTIINFNGHRLAMAAKWQGHYIRDEEEVAKWAGGQSSK